MGEPQRHLPRSGLLKDFTKVPSVKKKMDNTFERVYGQRRFDKPIVSSCQIGKFFVESKPIDQKPNAKGPRELLAQNEFSAVVDERISRMDAEEDAKRNNYERFTTTSASCHSGPDTVCKNQKRPSCETASQASESTNSLYDIKGPAISLYYQVLKGDDISARNSIRASACTNPANMFTKNTAFSCQTEAFQGKVHKDLEVNAIMNRSRSMNYNATSS